MTIKPVQAQIHAKQGRLVLELHGHVEQNERRELESKILEVLRAVVLSDASQDTQHIGIRFAQGELSVKGIQAGKPQVLRVTGQRFDQASAELVDTLTAMNCRLGISCHTPEVVRDFVSEPSVHVSSRLHECPPVAGVRSEVIIQPPHLNMIERMGTKFSSFVRTMRRMFTYYIFLRPRARRDVLMAFRQVPVSDIPNMSGVLAEVASEWESNMRADNPELARVFEPGELGVLFQRQWLREANIRLQDEGRPPLTHAAVRKFELSWNLFVLQRTDKVTEELEQRLMRFGPNEYDPVDLANLALSDANRELLTKLWTRQLGSAIVKGRLNRTDELTSERATADRIQAASQYLNALSFMPDELKGEDHQWLTEIAKPDQVEQFLIAENAHYDLDYEIAGRKDLAQKVRVVKEQLRPRIQRRIANMTQYREATALVNCLIGDEDEERAFLNSARAILGRDNKLFKDAELRKMFLREVERQAISEYGLTNVQVERLRLERTKDQRSESAIRQFGKLVQRFQRQQAVLGEELEAELLRFKQAHRPPVFTKADIRQLLSMRESLSEEDQAVIENVFTRVRSRIETERKRRPTGNKQKGKGKGKKAKGKGKARGRKARDAAEMALLDQFLKDMEVEKQGPQAVKPVTEGEVIAALSQGDIESMLKQMTSLNSNTAIAALGADGEEFAERLRERQERQNALQQYEELKQNSPALRALVEEYGPKLRSLVRENADLGTSLVNSVKPNKEQRALLASLYDTIIDEHLDPAGIARLNGAKTHAELAESIRVVIALRKQIKQLPERLGAPLASRLVERLTQITHPDAAGILEQPGRNEKSGDTYARVLYGYEVSQDIEAGYDHPSQVPPSVVSALATISSYQTLQEGKATTTAHTRAEAAAALKSLAADPDIRNHIAQFAEDPGEEALADMVPGFIGRFVNLRHKPTFKIPAGARQDTWELAEAYVRLLPSLGGLTSMVDKATALLDKLDNDPASITESDKMTYREVAKLSKLSRFLRPMGKDDKSPLQILDKWGLREHLIETDPEVAKAYAAAESANALMDRLNAHLKPALAEHYKDGDILGYVGKKKEAWMGRKLGGEEKFTMLLCDHGLTHGMKLYHRHGEVYASHVYGNYTNEPFSLYHTLITDAWRIDIAKLIPEHCAELLRDHKGADWAEQVQAMYREEEHKIHGEQAATFEDIGNDDKRRMHAGLADYHSIINFFGGARGESIKSHSKMHESNFKAKVTRFMNGDGVRKTQICSEFAARSTLAALVRLNQRLCRALRRNYPNRFEAAAILERFEEKDIEPTEGARAYIRGVRLYKDKAHITQKAEEEVRGLLKQAGYTANDIDLTLRVLNEEIFDVPYDRRERMSRIHPGRMVTILESKNCVTKLKPPPLIQTLFKM